MGSASKGCVVGCVRQRRQPATKVSRRFSKGPLPITLSPTMNLKFQINHPGQYYSETMTTRGRVIAPPAPFNVEDGSSGVRRTEPRRKQFMDRGIHPTLEGAAGGSTQHWKELPKGCACISEYYRPGLIIQHWTRLCTQRIEKILTLWPVQTFHKGPHGIRLETMGRGSLHCHSYFFP